MTYHITYTLPDELELFTKALKDKSDYYKPKCPIENTALQEAITAITAYMLKSSPENLSNLNRILDKYTPAD